MKIELLKEQFENALQTAARVSNKNLSLPVLGCVVITAANNRATLQSTNLELSVEIQIKAKVEEEGIVAVSAHTINQLISTISDQKITLKKNESTLEVISSHGVSKLKTIDHSEFPTLPFVTQGVGGSLTTPTKELVYALKTVVFSASHSTIRPELSSVFLKVGDGFITTAATDSFRLSEIKIPTKTSGAIDPILIPARNVQEIVRIMGATEFVEVRIGENQVTFLGGESHITSRVIDGAFPDYHAIIPKNFTTEATVLSSEVVKTLRRVAVFSDSSGSVEVSVSKNNKKLTWRAENSSVGEITEDVDVVVEGGEEKLSFNIRYLLDALQTATSDSVVFKFSGPGRPLVITEVPHQGFTYLVMPMNK